jgi:hypothetical protein
MKVKPKIRLLICCQITVLRLPNHDLVTGVQGFGSLSTVIW